MKTEARSPHQSENITSKALKATLIHILRKTADAINANLTRLPRIWLKIWLLVISAVFGLYCISLLTGFL
ncbi:hypothetical protein ASG14_07305 [Pedobacter sp. Leaf194]|nr:hypothetical protein ASG14_07305 [Pedobacter sp. Leaf194]